MKWEQKHIRDFANVYDGPHATPKESEKGPIFLGIKNIKPEGGLDLTKIRYISDSEFEKWTKRVTPRKNDIVFSYEATLHRYAIIPNDFIGCLGRRMALVRVNEKFADHKFIYYTFLSDTWKGFINANKLTGATVDRISITDFPDYKVSLPPLPTQERIASILSAYDDLIENNLKRIKLLEEKAELHYTEMIHESDNWDKTKLGKFVSVVKGRKPNNVLEKPDDDCLLYLLLDTVERTKSLYTTDLTLPRSLESDVLMCMDGARSGLTFRGMSGAIGSTMAIWRSNSERISGEFLFQFMKQNQEAIIQGNTGAAIPHANRKFILEMEIGIPPQKVAANFDKITMPLLKLVNNLHNQNTKLREARDILLPKLMNGEIEV